MSIEIISEYFLTIKDDKKAHKIAVIELSQRKNKVQIIECNSFDYNCFLNKPELAQLIAALQAMHDKMGDLC